MGAVVCFTAACGFLSPQRSRSRSKCLFSLSNPKTHLQRVPGIGRRLRAGAGTPRCLGGGAGGVPRAAALELEQQCWSLLCHPLFAKDICGFQKEKRPRPRNPNNLSGFSSKRQWEKRVQIKRSSSIFFGQGLGIALLAWRMVGAKVLFGLQWFQVARGKVQIMFGWHSEKDRPRQAFA